MQFLLHAKESKPCNVAAWIEAANPLGQQTLPGAPPNNQHNSCNSSRPYHSCLMQLRVLGAFRIPHGPPPRHYYFSTRLPSHHVKTSAPFPANR